MRVRPLLPATMLLTLLVACSGSAASPVATAPDAISEPAPGGGKGGGSEEDANPPHALGTIVLGESHESAPGSTRGIVSVSFVPDAAGQKSCTLAVAGCQLTIAPKCDGCDAGEMCTWDATCAPKCHSKLEESFDGGPIAISGAATPLTLYPPYALSGSAGAPFVAGAELRVQGSGALAVGFEKFDETFTATQFLQTSPALGQLPRSSVWGDSPVPLTWVPGKDTISVTISGPGGSLRCQADDAKGRFDVPREVIKTALGPAPVTTVTIALARERAEIKKGTKTKGQLASSSVQPIGWLSLATTSVESASFQCAGVECTGNVPPSCQDCRTSLCKTEFDACTADATCPMLRTCLDACPDAACRSACFVKWPDPVAKAKNAALFKCQCTTQCAMECAVDCK